MAVQISGNDITVPRDTTVTRNLTVGGVLTYEDVTNVDSVGLITARSGIEIGASPGVAASISVDGNMIVSGISTFGGDVQVPDKIIHSGDTNTAIRFPAADTITAETAGSERLRITSNGIVNIGDGLSTEYLDSTLKIRKDQDAVTRVTLRNENQGSGSASAVQIGAYGNSWMLQCGSAANDSNAFTIRSDGTSNSNTGTERVKIASGGDMTLTSGNLVIGTAGKGIDFSAQTATSISGASATAEILDHYEEGTWTPSYLNVTVTGYGHQSGTYTRIGRAVHCQFQISVDSGLDTSDTSAISIGGLPFVGNSAHEACVFSFGKLTSILPDTRLAEVTNFRFGGNFIQLHRGSSYDLNYSFCNSSGHMQGAFTYQMT